LLLSAGVPVSYPPSLQSVGYILLQFILLLRDPAEDGAEESRHHEGIPRFRFAFVHTA